MHFADAVIRKDFSMLTTDEMRFLLAVRWVLVREKPGSFYLYYRAASYQCESTKVL